MITVKFYGARGSTPVCEPHFQEFGGNTTCILIMGEEQAGILDAGTGIRKLGKDILASNDPRFKKPIWMLFSHFHWDHIQGFPFFAPAYDSSREFVISAMGRDRLKKDLRSILADQQKDLYFPVPLDEMGANFLYHHPEVESTKVVKTQITASRHPHPGGAWGYRIVGSNGETLVIVTDVEYGDAVDQDVVALAKGADLLIHDAQYTPEELKTHRGWGHSTWEQAVWVAEQAGAKQLVLTHHDPDHDDAFLGKLETEVQKRLPSASFAREGMEIEMS
jgi:phosphoribosyl 1,2-cyclic phosphodiesterase